MDCLVGCIWGTLGVIITIISIQLLPPNKGELTIAEFVENCNYYSAYYGVDYGNYYLDQSGEWVEKDFDGHVYFDIGHTERPLYQFTTVDGKVTGINYSINIINSEEWIGSYNTYMIIDALAFACSQDEVRLFTTIQNRISKSITDNTFRDFSLIESGVIITCETDYSGYINGTGALLIPDDDASENSFKLNFSMTME